jgi:hypothetical protein
MYTYLAMKNYSKETLLYWLGRYNKEEDLYNTGVEQELRDKFQKNHQMTLEDLKRIVEWKFATLPGRKKRVFNLLRTVDDDYVRKVSELAFETDDDKTRLTLLCSIRGVGNALSSTILAFYDPNRYGVLDIHDYREIFGLTLRDDPKDLFTNQKHVHALFQALRKISGETGLCCRDVEKALFKKNYEESK